MLNSTAVLWWNCLHFLVPAAPYFSLGVLGSDRLLKSSEIKVWNISVYFSYQVELHLGSFCPMGGCGSQPCSLSEWCLCTGSCWLSWWGAHVWIRLIRCCGFLYGIAGISFSHFLIPYSGVSVDAKGSTVISAAFSVSLLICVHSHCAVLGSYQGSASPSSPLELGKHFCCSSHSSQWFFTIIVAVWSLAQILEPSISHILSSMFVRMQNQCQV